MTKLLLITALIFSSLTTFAQTKMRSLNELINKADPGWTFVKQWIDSAKNKVEILQVDKQKQMTHYTKHK